MGETSVGTRMIESSNATRTRSRMAFRKTDTSFPKSERDWKPETLDTRVKNTKTRIHIPSRWGGGRSGAVPDADVFVLPRRAGDHPGVRRDAPRVVREPGETHPSASGTFHTTRPELLGSGTRRPSGWRRSKSTRRAAWRGVPEPDFEHRCGSFSQRDRDTRECLHSRRRERERE